MGCKFKLMNSIKKQLEMEKISNNILKSVTRIQEVLFMSEEQEEERKI